MKLEIKCRTCKHSRSNTGQEKSCMIYTVYDGLRYCVNRGYKDWQQYIPETNDFIKESEMKI